MSRLQLQEGLLDDALQSLTRAFEMDMKNARVAIELGQLALDLDSEEVASRAYRAVTMLRPGADEEGPEGALQAMRAHAQFQLAMIARNKGDARRARMLVTKALSDNPEHPQAQALLAELDGG
jgi:lipopolysaccharide biosynthesis regulator YciM